MTDVVSDYATMEVAVAPHFQHVYQCESRSIPPAAPQLKQVIIVILCARPPTSSG